MENNKINLYKKLSLTFISVLILIVLIVSFVTYMHQNITSADPIIHWTVIHHFSITVVLILLSSILGYFLSFVTYSELRKNKIGSEKLLSIVLRFLQKEEKEIMNYLVKNDGEANQADIARLPSLNRVKAFRALQKMQEKNLLTVTAHGKLRRVTLSEEIIPLLQG